MVLKKSTKRLVILIFILCLFWFIGLFVVNLFKDSIEYYITCERIDEKFIRENKNKIFRLGGMIVPGSIVIDENKKQVSFKICDEQEKVFFNIVYNRLSLPPIFRENVGVIAKGILLDSKTFLASELIGKHDENYMPPDKKK